MKKSNYNKSSDDSVYYCLIGLNTNLNVLIKLMSEQNKILSKNTMFTGGGFLVGAVALVFAIISLFLTLK